MKKWTALLSGFAISSLLLAGCGTTSTDEGTDSKKEENTITTNTQNKVATTEDTTVATETTTQEQTSEIAKEKQLHYRFQDKDQTATALLKTSDNQPFSLYVIPEFELSAEEPGKDVVLFKENDQIFMRIELLAADIDWATAETEAQAFLKAISDTVTDSDLTLDNGSSYQVTTDNDVVTVVLLKNEKLPVRITMFTTKDADYRHAFLAMANTIQKQ